MTFKGWRTIAFNIVSGLVLVLESTDLSGVIPETWHPYIPLVIVLGNIGLRFITTTAVGRKA